jgi:L-asparaginase II
VNLLTEPLVEVTRSGLVGSQHRGAIAVVDASGCLLHSLGDSQLVTFVRSSAKPIQLLPLVESGAADRFSFSPAQLAVMAASHNGESFHMAAVQGILNRIGVSPEVLHCGAHLPLHQPTAEHMRAAGEAPTQLHNNCSGKHAGMLALAVYRGYPVEGYYRPDHPVQQEILATLARMTAMDAAQIEIGVDGCSVPTFALPLWRMALGFARLVDPHELSRSRQRACHTVVAAMQAHPEMVAGTERMDTDLMRAAGNLLIAKGGAEGYQSIGILPDPAAGRSLGIGIALKVEDGDPGGRARCPAVLEVLRQLGVLDEQMLEALAKYRRPAVRNVRGDVVGEIRPCFELPRR